MRNHQINNVREFLYMQGYDEKSLNSPEKKGTLMDQIKQELVQYKDLEQPGSNRHEINVSTYGMFNEKKDAVCFHFTLHFDTDAQELNITKLYATLNGNRKGREYAPNEIPLPQEVYHDLDDMRKYELANKIAHHVPRAENKQQVRRF